MSRIPSDKTAKIDLENDEWIEVKSNVPYEELQAIIEGKDKIVLPLVELAIVGWCLKDDNGAGIAFSKELVKKLDFSTINLLFPKLTEMYGLTITKKKLDV